MKTIKKVFIPVMLVVMLLGCNFSFAELNDLSQFYIPLPKDGKITIEFSFSFDKNLIFEQYPVSMYLDNKHIVDLPHGQGYEGKIQVSPGKHQLCFYKSDDKNWNGIFEFEAYEYTFIVGKIHTNYSRVDVSGLNTKARYSLVSGEYLDWLKEYDTVMDNLHYYFDTAYSESGKTGRRTGHYVHYYLFNSKGNNYMFYGQHTSPAGTASSNVDAPEFGTYDGNLSSGKFKLTGAKEYFGDEYKICDFEFACVQFIRFFDNSLYRKRSDLMYYFRKNEPKYYSIIFPDRP